MTKKSKLFFIILLALLAFNYALTTSGATDDAPDTQVITFTVDGIEYQADRGMTWADWLDSKYNIHNFRNDIYGTHYAGHVLRDKYSLVCELKKGNLDSVRNCDEIKAIDYRIKKGTWLPY